MYILFDEDFLYILNGRDCASMMTSSNGNIFWVTGPLCREFTDHPHKDQWRGAVMFSLISTWINVRVNYGEAGDLRFHEAHYDIIVIPWLYRIQSDFYPFVVLGGLLSMSSTICFRDHFVYAPSQWGMMLQCKTISHWLGANTKWSLCLQVIHQEKMTHTVSSRSCGSITHKMISDNNGVLRLIRYNLARYLHMVFAAVCWLNFSHNSS